MNAEIARSVTKNTAVLFGSQAVTWTSSLLLMLFLPRYLGSVDYGRLYVVMSMIMMAHLMIDFGGVYFIPKEVARSRKSASALITNSLILRVFLWLVAFGGLTVFAVVADYPPVVRKLLLILGIAAAWESITRMLKSCFQGFEKMEYSAIGAIGERLFVTSAGISALLLGADVVIIGIIMACSTLLNLFLSSRLLRRLVRLSTRIDLRMVRRLLREGVPYFLWSIFAVVYYRIDAVMMSLMTPEQVVGWYGAAFRFFDVLMFVPAIFTTAVFPILARLWKEQEDSMRRMTGRNLELILMAGIPVSCCAFLFSDDIIALVFGNEYAPSGLLLRIFAGGLILVYLDMVLGTAIVASDRQKSWSLVALGAIPLNIGLNLLLIPHTQNTLGNGGLGAAVATLITEWAVMIAAIRLAPKQCFEFLRPMILVKGFVGGTSLCLIALFFDTLGFSWVFQAACGCLAYVFSLHMLEVFQPSELEFLRRFFSLENLRRLVPVEEGTEA